MAEDSRGLVSSKSFASDLRCATQKGNPPGVRIDSIDDEAGRDRACEIQGTIAADR